MRKKLISAFCVFILIIVSCLPIVALGTQNTMTTITIFHTNDQHGRFVGDDGSMIGIDRIATIKNSVPGALLFDAGDALHGLPIATLSKGADAVALMSAAGYDGMAAGNHDFNYGWARLQELGAQAGFPIFTSNITRNGEAFLDDTKLFEVNGTKIGVFGLTTTDTRESTMAENIVGLTFEEPVALAKARVASLKQQGAQVIVAITHLGLLENVPNQTTSDVLAEKVPDIDVIIDGHSHTLLETGKTVNGVLIAQANNYENYVGKVEIVIDNGAIISKTATVIDFAAAQAYTPDDAVTQTIQDVQQQQKTVLEQAVGTSKELMSAARAPGMRTQEMPLGNLVADDYRQAAQAQITIANGGDIREDMKAGTVTRGDIISILPFGNSLQVKKVTPAILKEALENGLSGIVTDPEGNIIHEKSVQGRFPQVSGFQFDYDPTQEIGQRVLSITLDNGIPLDLQDTSTQLTLAGSNYVMSGGDYYAMLGALPIYKELGAADAALSDYVQANSPIVAPQLGRITAVQKPAQIIYIALPSRAQMAALIEGTTITVPLNLLRVS